MASWVQLPDVWAPIPGTGEAVAAALKETSCAVESLHIFSVESKNDIQMDLDKICAAVKQNSSLKTIALLNVPLGTEGLEKVAEALAEHPSLSAVRITLPVPILGLVNPEPLLRILAIQRLATLDLARFAMSSKEVSSLADALLLQGTEIERMRIIGFRSKEEEDALSALISALKASRKLKALTLKDCQLGPVSVLALAGLIESSSSLKLLDVSNNGNIIGCNGSFQHFLQSIAKSSSLKSLILNECRITTKMALALSEAFALSNSNMSTLSLAKNSLRDSGAAIILKMIPGTKLRAVSLQGNRIIGQQNDFLAHFVSSLESSSLEFLDFSHNLVDPIILEGMAKALSEKPSSSLKSLNLSNSKLSDQALLSLGDFLISNPGLERINLSHNVFTSKALVKFSSEALKNNEILTHLNLSGSISSLDNAAIEALFTGLIYTSSITHLDLGFLRLDSWKMALLADVFAYNRSLTHVYLHGNPVKDEGVKFIIRAFSRRPSHANQLQHLNLRSCGIGREGCKTIEENLSSLKSLEVLNLAENNIADESAISLLRQVIEKSPCISTVVLWGNPLSTKFQSGQYRNLQAEIMSRFGKQKDRFSARRSRMNSLYHADSDDEVDAGLADYV